MWIAGCFITAVSFASTNPTPSATNQYFVNDQQIETLFTNSEDISVSSPAEVLSLAHGKNTQKKNSSFYAAGEKNFVAALLLDLFLGGLGIHRLYLGTKTMTWVGYILTCGGIVGIVPLVDLIVLIIHNEDISPYVDNSKFFMWSGGNM